MSSLPGLSRVVGASATAVAVSLFGLALPSPATAQTVEGSAEIMSRIEEYLEAWNAHDPAALAAFFTPDADFVMGNLPAVRGREGIRDWWQAYFERQEPERQLTLDVSPVRFVAPDVALITVATTTGGRDHEGVELPPRRFRGTWLWHRQDDAWLIAAMHGLPTEEDRVVLNASLDAAQALRPDIRAFVAAYEDAFNRHDPSAVSAFFRDDAEIIVRNSHLIEGGEAIEDWWRSYFAEPRPYRALLIIDQVRMIETDVALVTITGTGAVAQSADELLPVRYTRATWVLAREAREWRIAALWVLPSEDDTIVRGAGRPN